MFIRNFLKAGDYVTMIPIGLMLKVQYNEKGMIEKIYTWPSNEDHTDELLTIILDNSTVPRKIPIVNGTSWVYGLILDPNYVPIAEGTLPECINDLYFKHFTATPGTCKFYAATIYSHAIAFKAAISTRQWLVANGFETLPGFIFAANSTEESFTHALELAKLPINMPRISGYMTFGMGECEYHPLSFKQYVVKSVQTFSDMSGRIYGKLTHSSGELNVDFSEIVKFNIHPNSLILCDEDDEILWYYTAQNVGAARPSQIACPSCGKLISVVPDRITQCSDPHCNSRLFGRVNQMLKTFNLPTMSYEDYQIITQQYGLEFAVPDALTWEKLEDKLPVQTSISYILRAIVPEYVVPASNSSLFNAFCNRCNNAIDTVRYYITYPDKIATEPMFEGLALNSFLVWLGDPQNVNDVMSLLSSDYLQVTATDRKFDGAPIFRSNIFAITGKFMHGTSQDIISILQSYSGTVVDKFQQNLTCLIVGDLNEDVNGYFIRQCKTHRIPVVSESEFFAKYDIDSDLVENLK